MSLSFYFELSTPVTRDLTYGAVSISQLPTPNNKHRFEPSRVGPIIL